MCASTTTSELEVESYEGQVATTTTHTPVGVDGCGTVPFTPTAELQPQMHAGDEPDGVTTVIKAPRKADSTTTADIRDVQLTLPEGLRRTHRLLTTLAPALPRRSGSAPPRRWPARKTHGSAPSRSKPICPRNH